MHVMLPESSPSSRGPGIATPAGLLPSVIAPHLRSLSSTGITRRLQSYGPLSATPTGPACPSRGSGWCVPHHRQGFPCCSHPPLPCVPPPIPRRDQPVRLSLTSRPVAAFPKAVPAGRLPHSRFRGLLSVHSRCGPHGRWITLGDPLRKTAAESHRSASKSTKSATSPECGWVDIAESSRRPAKRSQQVACETKWR